MTLLLSCDTCSVQNARYQRRSDSGFDTGLRWSTRFEAVQLTTEDLERGSVPDLSFQAVLQSNGLNTLDGDFLEPGQRRSSVSMSQKLVCSGATLQTAEKKMSEDRGCSNTRL